jgi:hypothetical protein
MHVNATFLHDYWVQQMYEEGHHSQPGALQKPVTTPMGTQKRNVALTSSGQTDPYSLAPQKRTLAPQLNLIRNLRLEQENIKCMRKDITAES